jgi:redox-sensing transcriptional repressor
VETVSSRALSKVAGVKPAQLRKDLAHFGQFGTRGLGYSVAGLASAITEVLGRNSFQPVILVGAGNLGTALLRYGGFNKEGFEIRAAFDVDPDRPRGISGHVEVLPYDCMIDYMREHEVKMAIVAVPANVVQSVANDLVDGGVQAILNFSGTVLEVPEKVVVNNVDLALELESLSYFVR